MRKIHWNAFGKQSKKIQLFGLRHLPNLTNQSDGHYDMIKLINLLINCKTIYIQEVFDYELKPIKLNKLKKISFGSEDSLIKLESICPYAFYECDKIEEINLEKNDIHYINEK